MPDNTEELEWPERMYLLHPSVKTFGDMITIPERQEYVHADRVKALEVERDSFYEEAMHHIALWGKALAENTKLEAHLAKAVGALRAIKDVECVHCTDFFHELADAVLAEIGGEA